MSVGLVGKSKARKEADARGQRVRRKARRLRLVASSAARRYGSVWHVAAEEGPVIVKGLSLDEVEVVLDVCLDDLVLHADAGEFGSELRAYGEERGLNTESVAGAYDRLGEVLQVAAVAEIERVVNELRAAEVSFFDMEAYGLLDSEEVLLLAE